MRIRKTLIAVSALAVAIAFSPELRAATFASPDTKVSADSLIQKAAAKKKASKGKKAKSKAGRCGTYMYYKKGKCLDARNKK